MAAPSSSGTPRAPGFSDLPEDLARCIADAAEVNFATVTASGVPVANALFYYYEPGGPTIDVATGLAYPAKAERARRNPNVGLLFARGVAAADPVYGVEHGPRDPADRATDPVVVVAARAAVRDSDLQANTDRYVDLYTDQHPLIGPPWEEARRAVWYWTRIWIECTPVRILWWPNGVASGEPPRRWEAPADQAFPESDPAPAGAPTRAARWPAGDWRERAPSAVAMVPTPTLTVVDPDGYPLPFGVASAALTGEGFDLELASVLPWTPKGPACLTFAAMGNFVGEVQPTGDGSAAFTVDHLIGDLPFIFDPGDSLPAMMERLQAELDRRAQPQPEIRRSRDATGG